jgi:alpha-L-rhamnosidase
VSYSFKNITSSVKFRAPFRAGSKSPQRDRKFHTSLFPARLRYYRQTKAFGLAGGLILLFILPILSCTRQPSLTFEKLLVEYAENPINIDVSQPRFSWIISSEERNKSQSAYRILVATDKNLLKSEKADIWDSGKINSSETIQHEFSGKTLESNSKYFWKVIVWDENDVETESPVATFETALLNQSDWQASWIGAGPAIQTLPEKGFLAAKKDEQGLTDTVQHLGQSLLLRKEIQFEKKIKSARAFVTGPGFYEFYINGQRVGENVLAPAKTPYHKHILYDTYDVTSLLKKGENAFGFHLGNGWYNPYKNWWAQYRMQWFGHKKALGQIHIKYNDGTSEIIKTDGRWKFSDGPVTFNCIYDGEVYDARLEQKGWNEPGFDDSGWKPVTIFEKPAARLESHTMPPVKVVQIVKPVEIKSAQNLRIFDTGQNFSGWVKIKISGEKGTKIKMRFAEDIFPDSTLDVSSNEKAKATAEYILKGDGIETYEPRFTWFGFKYVEVTAENGPLKLAGIVGCVVHTENRQIGNFDSSNELVNKIHRATVWSQKSNMIGYPMDCPQRDERLGWFGDAQVTAEEAMFNFDMARFYENWFEGIKDNQDEKTGDLPIISPQPYIWDEGVEWSSTYFTMVWQFYQYYGDKRALARHYEPMKRYMQFLDSISDNYIVPMGWIGDWGSMVKGWKEGQPESVPTAFYFYDAVILSKIASVLGNETESQQFAALAEEIRSAYNKKYFNTETGNYNDGSQMANAFPLFLGIVPEAEKLRVLENLVNDIVVNNDNHLTTGVLGTKYMPEALAQLGRADVAWNIINQKTYPSWNSMMEKYTTVCEFWTLKQSKNHVMMGSIDAWFYKYVAGIQPDETKPAFSEFIIKPHVLNGLTYAEGKTETIRGTVSSKWKVESGKFVLEVEVPFNNWAKVFVPANENAELFEGDKPVKEAEGVEYIGYSEGMHSLKVSSGKYKFLSELK